MNLTSLSTAPEVRQANDHPLQKYLLFADSQCFFSTRKLVTQHKYAEATPAFWTMMDTSSIAPIELKFKVGLTLVRLHVQAWMLGTKC